MSAPDFKISFPDTKFLEKNFEKKILRKKFCAKMTTQTRSINGRSISNAAYFKLAFYTLLMALCPLGSFFWSRNFFKNNLAYEHMPASIRAAVVSVVVAHIVIGMFIYSAWQEDEADIEEVGKKKD